MYLFFFGAIATLLLFGKLWFAWQILRLGSVLQGLAEFFKNNSKVRDFISFNFVISILSFGSLSCRLSELLALEVTSG